MRDLEWQFREAPQAEATTERVRQQNERNLSAVEAMSRYGGAFIMTLAKCYRVANDTDRRRLFIAFQHEFAKYAGFHNLTLARQKYTENLRK
jgi:hypothetical protein